MKMGDLVVILRGLVVKIISLVVIVKYWKLLKEESKTEKSFGDSQNKQFQSKGDPIADLYEDIEAEEKARATYQWLIDISDDPYINDSLRFLRERENVHSMRFREAVEMLKEDQAQKKIF